MTVCVVHFLEVIHVNENKAHGVGIPLEQIAQGIKGPAVQQPGKGVMFGLMTEHFVLVLLEGKNVVVGQGKMLELVCPHKFEHFIALDALQIDLQRLDDQGNDHQKGKNIQNTKPDQNDTLPVQHRAQLECLHLLITARLIQRMFQKEQKFSGNPLFHLIIT